MPVDDRNGDFCPAQGSGRFETAANPKVDIAINHALLIEANIVIGICEQARTAQLNA